MFESAELGHAIDKQTYKTEEGFSNDRGFLLGAW